MTVLPPHVDRQPDVGQPHTEHPDAGHPDAGHPDAGSLRGAPAPAHPAWCVHHHPQGCLGAPTAVPGSPLRVWLWAPTAGDARLVVDGPGGYGELPVDA